MRLLPVLLAAVLIATCATPVQAEDAALFTYFRTICGPSADPVAGAVRAIELGFAPAKKTPKVGDLQDVLAFEKTIGGREFFVITGRGRGKPKNGVPASATSACGVGVKGKDEAAMAAGRRWVGVPVSRSVLGVAFHAYRQTAGGLNVLTVSSFGGSTVLFLSRSRAAI